MKQVLFFSCTVQGLKKLVPIIKKMQALPQLHVKTVVVGWREVEYCEQNHIGYHTVDEYSALKRVDDWDTELAIDAVKNLLTAQKPDLLVSIDSGGFMESMFRFCRQNHIPTVVLQHGPLVHRLYEVPLEADKYLYWGNYFVKQLNALLQIPLEKIEITGSAQFDETLKKRSDRTEFAKKNNLDATKDWYVFCGQTKQNIPLDYSSEQAVQGAAAVLRKQENALFIYKPHPDQPLPERENLKQMLPDMVVLEEVDTVELLLHAKAMMTYYSTVAIDAALLGKPVLLFNKAQLKETVLPLYQLGAAICCDKAEKIETSVEDLIKMESSESVRQVVIQQLNGASNGQAVERITKECLRMLQA